MCIRDSLSPKQNQALREGFAKLKSPAKRRAAFFKLAGKRAELSLRYSGEYFGHPQAVVPRTQPPRLYDDVLEKLDALKLAGKHYEWKEIDYTISKALENEIDKNRDVHSRERLHLAIYGGDLRQFRHFYEGQAEQTDDPQAQVHLEWRYLVNSLYNYDLASRYRSCPVFNDKWYRLPSRLTLQEDQPAIDRTEEIESVPIEAIVYRELLTIPFVASVRRETSFWDAITKMETAQQDSDQKGYVSAVTEHVQIVSSLFKKFLIDSGHRDKVKPQIATVMARPLAFKTFAAAAALDAACGLWLGLPPVAVGGMVIGHSAKGMSVYFALTRVIGLLKPTTEDPRLNSFKVDLERVAYSKLPRAHLTAVSS